MEPGGRIITRRWPDDPEHRKRIAGPRTDLIQEIEVDHVHTDIGEERIFVQEHAPFTTYERIVDLVDATDDGEVHGVKKEAYWKVVDQCYLCDLCYMTKCPYTPPHEWNLDFPHLMLRAKAIKFKKGEVKGGEKFLASTDVHGQFAGIPVVVQVVNAVNRTKFARKQMDSMLGVHPDAWMPELAPKRFRWGAEKSLATVVTQGQRTPGKVAIFATCYVNYNEPGIGHDLLKVLAHNDIPYVIVDKESCCGMPNGVPTWTSSSPVPCPSDSATTTGRRSWMPCALRGSSPVRCLPAWWWPWPSSPRRSRSRSSPESTHGWASSPLS